MRKIIPILFIVSIICISFNKPGMILTDYRDVYVGSYFCNSKCSGLNTDHTAKTTSTDTMTIVIAKDPVDSILQISIRGNAYRVKLFLSGKMKSDPRGKHWSGHFYSTDSVSFGATAGLAPYSCLYKGKKN